MTEQETIIELMCYGENGGIPEAVKIAVFAIGEIQRYRAIDTIEECQKAVERQTDVCKTEYLGENFAIGCRIGRCRCVNLVRSYHDFCNESGAKLNWNNVYPGNRDVQH